MHPGTTVVLDGSASSDPNGDPLTYCWMQTGGEAIGFSPAVSVTTFVAPRGQFTFTLIVTNTAGLTDTDTTVIAATNTRIYLPVVLTVGPQAHLAPDHGGTSLVAGSHRTVTHPEAGRGTGGVRYALSVAPLPRRQPGPALVKPWAALREEQVMWPLRERAMARI
ncbi:MAG TPA: hypothetical protein ENO24_07315 [Chloroflexi bacterium]|nr:hypothetical protein [Chloroflexota bacterium]